MKKLTLEQTVKLLTVGSIALIGVMLIYKAFYYTGLFILG